VEAREPLGRQLFRTGQQRTDAFVAAGHLPLLPLRQRLEAQDQDLVDLGAVEEVTRALGGDARVVVEDDRRAQQEVALAGLAHQDRPQPLAAAALLRFA
jgi:hypothetical protein